LLVPVEQSDLRHLVVAYPDIVLIAYAGYLQVSFVIYAYVVEIAREKLSRPARHRTRLDSGAVGDVS